MEDFFSLGGKERLGKKNFLVNLNKLINWSQIETIIKSLKLRSRLGRGGYSELSLFKSLLLGQWYSLSDPGLEESLRVRLDFMLFTGFQLGSDFPDETTFCKYRNLLVEANAYDKLLQEINYQLESHNLKLSKADHAIVDASLVSSAARPNKVIKGEIAEDRLEDKTNSSNNSSSSSSCEISLSSDEDARWLKKGKKSIFGYKSFAAVDEEGYINKTHTTPANKAECNELDKITDGIKAKRVTADKAYDSKANRKLLKKKNFKSGLMFKAQRNKPLRNSQKRFNKLISKTRYVVEQDFGTLKRKFCFTRSSYFGLAKTQAQFTMKAICLNLLKALNKIKAFVPKGELRLKLGF